MDTLVGIVVSAAAILDAIQGGPPVQMVHLYTFGSRYGIHPPRILNRKAARAALGDGISPYGLKYPTAVTTDLRGQVWIADRGTHSIHVFGEDGIGYREIRRVDGVPLGEPAGITSDEQGRVYVTDAGGGEVLVFDEKGEFDRWMVKRGSGVLAAPTAIALSEDGRTVYVLDPPGNRIVELNREGEVNGTISLPEDLRDPGSMAVVHNQICVLGRQKHKVGVFSPAGRRRDDLSWSDVRYPAALGFDAARGRFLIVNPRWMIVQIFDEAGRGLGSFGQSGPAVDQMERVDFVYADHAHRVYLIDTNNGKVLVFAER
jgi:DNA-binding beta-propeller fold protein YncE